MLFFFTKGFQEPLIISCDLQTGQVCVTEVEIMRERLVTFRGTRLVFQVN